MAFMSLAHQDARTIPVAIFGLGFLFVIEAARAQKRSQAHLVLGQSLDDYSRYSLVRTQRRSSIGHICIGKSGHGPF
jgi:hypothetical protein